MSPESRQILFDERAVTDGLPLFAGDLVAPLINRAAIKADYLSANAMQLRAVYEYQRVILNAFTEVINRLAKVENYGRSIEIKTQQLRSLELSMDSATKPFQSARAEYMDVLLAQRDLMEARMVLIETKQQQLTAIINAYQALGGGGLLTNQPHGGAYSPPPSPPPVPASLQPELIGPGIERLPSAVPNDAF